MLPCDALSMTPFCATWPRQVLADALESRTVEEIRQAVGRTLAPFAAGVQPAQLAALMLRPCMQRMCFHVQLIEGDVFVVAPPDIAACRKGVDVQAALSCLDTWPKDESTWLDRKTCLKYKDKPQSAMCGAEWRMRQPGVSVPGWWYAPTYPHVSEWHFAAGLNLSNCQSAGESIAGDHNYVFSRLRMGSMLRLLWRAYRR